MTYNDLKEWIRARRASVQKEWNANEISGKTNGTYNASKAKYCSGYICALDDVLEYLAGNVEIQ